MSNCYNGYMVNNNNILKPGDLVGYVYFWPVGSGNIFSGEDPDLVGFGVFDLLDLGSYLIQILTLSLIGKKVQNILLLSPV